ncbi:MAG: hypothetical protein J6C62_04090, partial [Clostridia bacterium]|nr:hypothetical protein [Clostridia bacterium]
NIAFRDYVKNFRHRDGYTTIQPNDDFVNEFFANTNIRKQIKIIEKAKLVHSLMPENSGELSIDYMAVEILLTMISFVYDLDVKFNTEVTEFNDVINLKSINERELWVVHNKVFHEQLNGGIARYFAPDESRKYHMFNKYDTWSILYMTLLKLWDNDKLKLDCRFESSYHYDIYYVNQIIKYSKQFFDTLKLIS